MSTRMMFTDQRWIDFVPSFFDHHILKDPGYNVAYWNLHGREVTSRRRPLSRRRSCRSGSSTSAASTSGKPWLLSKHQGERPRVLLSERPALRASVPRLRWRASRQPGIDAEHGPPVRLGRAAAAASRIDDADAAAATGAALVAPEQGAAPEPPDPFDAAQAGRVSRLVESRRPRAGPDGSRATCTRSTAIGSICRCISRPLTAPTRPASPTGSGATASSRRRSRRAPAASASVTVQRCADPLARRPLAEGLNIAGYFRAELGIGEAARLLIAAIEAAGIPLIRR